MEIDKVVADYLDPQDVREMLEQEQDQSLEELLSVLGELYKEYDKPRSSYFALLMADGDNMGAWLGLSGKAKTSEGEVVLRNKPLTECFHRDFSKRLSNYALEVQKRAEGEGPFLRLVYAGGDDVLAVGYPINLVKFAVDIRELFSQKVYAKATLSAGLVIGHEKENLRFLLQEVREAEKLAKKAGRDRLCISVVTRNSSPVRVVLRWEDVALLERLIGYFSKGLLSSNLPYALRVELQNKTLPKQVVSALVRRLLLRKKD
ncbi:MAG: type III-B CRISPR-associated protein Cas10/Cmr2, partial [Gemmatales bacterium]|nr:type III-B CRISPR-associated protein Cas10/Cmr2 [Gemmatales bacterium]